MSERSYHGATSRSRLEKAGVSDWFVPTISADFGTPTADSPLGASLVQWILFHTLHSSKVYRLVQGLRVSRAREVRKV